MARSQKKEEAEDLQPADELEPELTVLKPGIDPNEIDASPAPQLDPTLFPLVGIGASAGGLEALEEFFSSMPQDSGAAFVVIMHLSPTRDSLLVDLLQKFTKMTVVQIENAMPLLPNRVHVIPPNREVRLLNGVLQLMEPLPKVRFPLVIDIFFRNLAVDRRRNAVCVILSGSGSDGSLGLRDVKENGGLVIVQDPTTAIHTGMPRSAIETGLADYVLSPSEMAEVLLDYTQRAHLVDRIPVADPATLDALSKIFLLLRSATDHDFSSYRINTLLRRITKRMAVQRLEKLDDYTLYLRQNPAELLSLFHEILIGVTQFFRDPEAFEALRQVLPNLFQGKRANEPLRVWVPGSSTGEEAYTLAMLIHESKQEYMPTLKIEIFATDINHKVIEQARLGEYPISIAADVPARYLERYFNKLTHSYMIKTEIREMVIFAQQNLLQDPPFSKLDLVSCRNLLIYLKTDTQRKVLSLFQYALKDGGYLFLGPSENIGDFGGYFAITDRKWRLFRRSPLRGLPPTEVEFFQTNLLPQTMIISPDGRSKPRPEINRRELIEQALLNYRPLVGILVDENYDILYSYGKVDLYMRMVPGESRLNILDMARSGLQIEVTTAIRQVLVHQKPVQRSQIRVKTNGDEKLIDFTVKPISTSVPTLKLVVVIIEEAVQPVETNIEFTVDRLDGSEFEDPRLEEMSRELETTKQYLQRTIEELQTANEELRSFNEEIQSANEELQSTNEELTTSQEELQSVNEELVTANAEILNKNEALRHANNDLNNLLVATELATIFLKIDLTIQRFTPAATRIINLINTDVGRPLKHIVSNLQNVDLIKAAEGVLDTLKIFEQEAQIEEGRWYNLRILPYRTLDNVIDGLVITFAEITHQKETEIALQQLNEALQNGEFSQNIIDTLHEGLLILDDELRIESANRAFYQRFQLTRDAVAGVPLFELDKGQWDQPGLHEGLAQVIAEHKDFENLEIEQTFARIGSKTLRLNARPLVQLPGNPVKIVLAVEDITPRL